MEYSTEQINAAWRAVGAADAGLKWDSFVVALRAAKCYAKIIATPDVAVSDTSPKVMDEVSNVPGEIDIVYTFGGEWRMTRSSKTALWVMERYGEVIDSDAMRNDLLQRHGFAVVG